MKSLKELSNDELVVRAKEAVKKETEATLDVIEYFKEIYKRRIHLESGLPFFEYVVQVLHYSRGSAHRRISAMELSSEIPESVEAIKNGELNLTVASQIHNVIKKEKKLNRAVDSKQIYEELKTKSENEIRQIYYPEDPKITVDLELLKKLEAIRKLIPNRDLNDLLHQMADETLSRLEMEMAGDRMEVRDQKVANNPREGRPPNPITRYTRKSDRNLVWREGSGQCEYRDKKTGTRCPNKNHLQFDHLNPYAMGGTSSAPNLRLLCRAHNQFVAIRAYGERKMSEMRKE